MFTVFDPLLITAALLVMIAGTAVRWRSWQRGRKEERSGDWKGLCGYLLSHRKIMRKDRSGIAHLLLFWGVLLPLAVIFLAQFSFVLPAKLAGALSLFLNLLGAAAIVGILFFLVRRMGKDGSPPEGVLPPAVLLLFILLSGFEAQGVRLNIVPAPLWTAPVGALFSALSPASPLFLQLLIRMHLLAVLLLVATLPFTFLRHVTAGALNVYYKSKGPRGALRPLAMEEGCLGAKTVEDLSWKQLLDAEACVSCGRCEENCPAFLSGKPLSPRKVIRTILNQMATPRGSHPLLGEAVTTEELWSCTTCMACVAHCPLYIDPLDKVVDMRRYEVLGKGAAPVEARPMLRNLELFGDVNGKSASHRTDWALNQEVPLLSGQPVEVLLWVGCSGAFHPAYRETTRAMVRILKKGQVSFAILGKEEKCCGDPARRLGEEALFLDLARENIRLFNRFSFKKIVTLCPHCFNVLKNEYPALSDNLLPGNFEVLHASQFVLELIEQQKITLKYPVRSTAAIHDPCYLGRANGVYEPLRKIAGAVPGLVLQELQRTGESGFCCGGGGGRMWLHESGTHINTLRAKEIAQSGVGLVSTACPYCLTMLEDGLGGLELEKRPKVRDLIDIVADSLG